MVYMQWNLLRSGSRWTQWYTCNGSRWTPQTNKYSRRWHPNQMGGKMTLTLPMPLPLVDGGGQVMVEMAATTRTRSGQAAWQNYIYM